MRGTAFWAGLTAVILVLTGSAVWLGLAPSAIGNGVIQAAQNQLGRTLTVRGGAHLAYGGDTLNTAVYLARQGAAVEYLTALGDDLCRGCGRTAQEVAMWVMLSAAEKEAIEKAIKDVEDVLRDGDKDVITAKTEALSAAAQKLGEKMYAQQQAEAGAAGPAGAAGGEQPKEKTVEGDVVDAEFTEVNKDKK